jgi:hypothetical protein
MIHSIIRLNSAAARARSYVIDLAFALHGGP